jgi:hypothetical protein
VQPWRFGNTPGQLAASGRASKVIAPYVVQESCLALLRSWHIGCFNEGSSTYSGDEQPMNNTSQTSGVKTEDLPQDILDLQNVIRGLPTEHRQKLDPLFARVLASTVRRRRILNLVQEALGQLRLDMKYLMFDLEATRRERDEYRRQVEGQ